MGDDIKLLEVSKDLANSISAGDILTIRGDEIENAVICSRDKTYDIKEAETSNSLLLVPSIVFPDTISKSSGRSLSCSSVSGIFHKYLELIEIRPRLRKMKDLLLQNPYNEDTRREGKKGNRYTLGSGLSSIVRILLLQVLGFLRSWTECRQVKRKFGEGWSTTSVSRLEGLGSYWTRTTRWSYSAEY